MKVLAKIGQQNKVLLVSTGFVLVGLIGFVDYLTGYEYAFSIFYVLPISLITWLANQGVGRVASILSAIVLFFADLSAGNTYSHPFIPIWNALIRLSFFILITFLLDSLKKSLQREQELSHTDYLTTAANSRYFYEIAQTEINRFQRYQHPFTIAYVDVDNFKFVNDHFGHSIGDLVLKTVVNSLKKRTRKTDLVARLGGDEFALFFPETNQESARVIIASIQEAILTEMQKNNWPVTFSIGVLTCNVAPNTTDDLVNMADKLMYSVKLHSKNAAIYSIYEG